MPNPNKAIEQALRNVYCAHKVLPNNLTGYAAIDAMRGLMESWDDAAGDVAKSHLMGVASSADFNVDSIKADLDATIAHLQGIRNAI